jgi:hypothetical protein
MPTRTVSMFDNAAAHLVPTRGIGIGLLILPL